MVRVTYWLGLESPGHSIIPFIGSDQNRKREREKESGLVAAWSWGMGRLSMIDHGSRIFFLR